MSDNLLQMQKKIERTLYPESLILPTEQSLVVALFVIGFQTNVEILLM